MSLSLDELQRALGAQYHIERELGGGGMSRVFVARDTTLGRSVVVKVLPPELAADVSVERFKREISLAARLQHPHIVPLLSAGQTGDAADSAHRVPYFTMPFIEGETLRARIVRTGELPVAESIRLLREIASALAYAHSKGVVHRDIKPENILLTERHAVVTDFGVAKALSAATVGGRAEVTSVGIALGTPAYMAPEQAAADPDTDHRADIYAFGIVAYEVLTGRTPFGNRPPQAIIAAHLSEAPEHVSRRRAAMPHMLADLLMRCLEKEPSRRPQSAEDLIRELDQLLSSSSAGRSGRPSVAVLPLVNTSGDQDNEHFSDGLTDELISALGKVPELTVSGRTSVFALKGKGLSTRAIADTLRVAHVVEGSVRRAGDRLKVAVQLVDADGAVIWSETYDRRLTDVFAVQEEIAQAVVGGLQIKLGAGRGPLVRPGSADPVAHDLYFKGRYVQRRFHPDDIRHSIDFFEQAVKRDPTYAAAYAALADAHALLVVFAGRPAHEQTPIARAYADRALALDALLADAHWAQAHVAFALEFDWARAGHAFDRMLELEPGHANGRHAHGIYLMHLERFDEAEVEYKRAIAADPLLAAAQMTLGRLYAVTGRSAEAIATLHESLALSPDFSYARECLADAYIAVGRFDEAIAECERAMVRGSARELAVLTYALGMSGRMGEARSKLRQLQSSAEYLPPLHMARAHLGVGDVDGAFVWLERACEEHDPHVTGLKILPAFQPLRGDPRFSTLLKRLGLDGTA